MRGLGRNLLAICLGVTTATAAYGQRPPDQPSSSGHPHKWQTVEKSMADFVNDGFDLKAVVYDPSGSGPPPALPDVHYFLQKKSQLVRCDFRQRGSESVYWCAMLVKPK